VLLALVGLAIGVSAARADFVVGVVPSDAPELAQPVGRAQEPTADQVLGMVRRAVALAGGMADVVPKGAQLVMIKPNIVSLKPSGSGVVTDARVVRAVALLVHEVAPAARVLIGEGGGWLPAAMVDSVEGGGPGPEYIGDGFAAAGYRDMVKELRQQGLDIDCIDLNFDQVRSLEVPGGGLATDEYSVAATVMAADAWINCPVAKTHGAKITCCMKNHFGLLPGRVYGWGKSNGTSLHSGVPHSPRIVDEAWVDLWRLTRMDLNVVDVLAGTEGGAFSGEPKRGNLIVAGRDPVATDLVVGQLMGFNPDDFEFAELAAQHGWGPGSIDHVTVRGARVEPLVTRYRKAGFDYSSGNEWRQQAFYGMGPRRWTVLGPLPKDHAFTAEQLLDLRPRPGRDGWSPVVWFGHDRIDLDQYLADPLDCAIYAYTHFTMPRADSVRVWAGSDEGLQAWIDGRLVHHHVGARRHQLGQDKVPAFLGAGDHALLVRVEQTRGGCEFSVNICEPIDDEAFAGNRYPGVRYYVVRGEKAAAIGQRVRAADAYDAGAVPAAEGALAGFDAMAAAGSAADSLLLPKRPTMAGPDLLALMAAAAGVARSDLDSAAFACLEADPFVIGSLGLGHEGQTPAYGPELGRLARWLGLRYGAFTGLGCRETSRLATGWLAHGSLPVMATSQTPWMLATGYRQRNGQVEFHLVGADTSFWAGAKDDWWAPFPGMDWRNCPMVVAEGAGEPLAPAALTDSLAALAVELARRVWVDDEPQPWGRRGGPAGVAAWDAWVQAWERRTFTPTEDDDFGHRDWFRWYVDGLAAGRRQAAAYFAAAAARTAGERSRLLVEASVGYGRAGAALTALGQAVARADDPATGEAAARRQALAQTRGSWRQARDGERQALDALVTYLGQSPLPPVSEDPLRLRPQGRRLLTWRASISKGVQTLRVQDQAVALQHLTGRPAEGVTSQVEASMPRQTGWQVAIEVVDGAGTYTVTEQPTAANDWTTVVRIDDEWTTFGNRTEVVLWALPTAP
jgi:uncharacterized protein (DUF362 family)